MGDLPEYKHFRLEQAAEGVYAAISVPGTGSLGNAAIVDLGDATLVVDTFLTIQAAEQLRDAAERLTGRPASYVFNTHWHADHTFGNQVFAPAAQIISTSRTRDIMAAFAKERLPQQLAEPEALHRAIDEWEEQSKQVSDAKLRMEMEWEVASDREYMRALPNVVYTLPAITFEQQITLHGSRRSAQLITYGGGHTQSDAFVYLSEDKIAITGDLVLSGHHLVLRFGNPQEWLHILDQVEALQAEIIVPGHGPVCSPDAIGKARTYLKDMFALAEHLVRSGGSPDAVQVPEAYRSWYFTSDFKTNLEVLCAKLTESAAEQ
ncbi:cyclase [Gordoniibacillus kamchatkensis]|uniref:Cyclase n=1 Tax=Gordoniibacillus kamchatkensis TaxID=1590651 RepID=A0ABR5AH30_9BACL|nr:cyclase [Paenibacillus sp. VKM B-2647]